MSVETEGELATYQPFHAARADIFSWAGYRQEAIAAYRCVVELTTNTASLHFLQTRLREVLDVER